VEDIKIRRLEWAVHIIRMEEERISKKVFIMMGIIDYISNRSATMFWSSVVYQISSSLNDTFSSSRGRPFKRK
jgi:ABC-type phosphate transport system auxiliary subunit